MRVVAEQTACSPGGGTGRGMKLRDGLTLAAIVGSLALIFVITRFDQPERVKPGSPEYDAYIEHYIAECLRTPQSIDKGASEPASQTEREAAWRVSVLQADRRHTDQRPPTC